MVRTENVPKDVYIIDKNTRSVAGMPYLLVQAHFVVMCHFRSPIYLILSHFEQFVSKVPVLQYENENYLFCFRKTIRVGSTSGTAFWWVGTCTKKVWSTQQLNWTQIFCLKHSVSLKLNHPWFQAILEAILMHMKDLHSADEKFFFSKKKISK